MGAIGNVGNYDPVRHGSSCAVVRYYTPYKNNQGQQLLLSTALGNSMYVNTILGNTVINEWRLALGLAPPLVTSEILRETFGLVYEPTQRSCEDNNLLDPTSASTAQIAVLNKASNGEKPDGILDPSTPCF